MSDILIPMEGYKDLQDRFLDLQNKAYFDTRGIDLYKDLCDFNKALNDVTFLPPGEDNA